MRGTLGLIVLLLIVFAVAAIGGSFTAKSVRDWYPSLNKPAFTPPSWLFGPAWTLLYTLMAIAAWLVLRRAEPGHVGVPMTFFAAQLALNLAWSVIFFGLRRPDLGLAEIVVLWVAILATMLSFWRLSATAGALFVPYLLWVSFASALNFELWRLNR